MRQTQLIFISLLILMLSTGERAFASQGQIFEHQVDQPFSGSQSPQDAYQTAVSQAKNDVLEMAGTYLESVSVVDNAQLTHDEVTALAAGILKTEIIERKNYATPKTFGLILRARIEVDKDILQQRLDKLLNDRSLLSQYRAMQQREKELLARIRELEAVNQRRDHDGSDPQFGQKFAQLSSALGASSWHEKALTLWQDGTFSDPETAMAHLEQAIKLDPEHHALHQAQAVAHLNLNQPELAEKKLLQALNLKPEDADTLTSLGHLHVQQQNYQQAIEHYNQAIALQPQQAEAWTGRGLAALKLEQHASAHKYLLQGARLSSEKDVARHAQNRLASADIGQLCTSARQACDEGNCQLLELLNREGICPPPRAADERPSATGGTVE
ncbi:MAG: tetratricopeptide repeat protein [Desulfuromonadaceae bacterium]|nr:tetratricopeptide repeat protein [Desulfuromonadaceae bacterium]